MQVVMAALALAVAGAIIWHGWRTILARHSPATAGRLHGRRRGDCEDGSEPPQPKLWIAPPAQPVIDIKAARVRATPAETVAVLPRRTGWEAGEDAQLMRLVAEGIDTAEIAARLHRSEKSVLLRIPLLNLRHRQAEQVVSQHEAACR
jgi:hypothetical protein